MEKGALLAVLLAVVSIDGEGHISLQKCCGEYEMLNGDGSACVDAPSPRNVTFHFEKRGGGFGIPDVIVKPLDSAWVRHWLPPGIPLERISNVSFSRLHLLRLVYFIFAYVVAVDSSAIWDGKPLPFNDVWKRRIVFTNDDRVVRPTPGGGVRGAVYCVDAAQPPLAPFAMVFTAERFILYDLVQKCCYWNQELIMENGNWTCRENKEEKWVPRTPGFKRIIDSETPIFAGVIPACDNDRLLSLRLEHGDERRATFYKMHQELFFSTWTTCTDYQRLADGSLAETLLYCEESSIARGVYRLLRPLSFVSVLLLAAALASVATNGRTRHTPPGWSLACHAACLLGFNAGHAYYQLTIGDLIFQSVHIPGHPQAECKTLAFSMYFLLVAAATWLTAVCVNMLFGFGTLQVAPRSRGGARWRFLALSAFAWGLPTIMTSLCAHFFNSNPHASGGIIYTGSSLTPKFSETRTCYDEIQRITNTNGKQ